MMSSGILQCLQENVECCFNQDLIRDLTLQTFEAKSKLNEYVSVRHTNTNRCYTKVYTFVYLCTHMMSYICITSVAKFFKIVYERISFSAKR